MNETRTLFTGTGTWELAGLPLTLPNQENTPHFIPREPSLVGAASVYDGLQKRLFDRLHNDQVLTPFYQNAAKKWVTLPAREWKNRFFATFRLLESQALPRGARVAIVLPDHPAWDLLEKASWALGLSYGGMEPYIALDSFRTQLAAAHPDLVIINREALIKFAPALGAARVVIAEDNACLDFAKTFTAPVAESYHWPIVRGDQPAMWSMTSGTTGAPKVISYTFDQVEVAAEAVLAHFDANPADRALAWLPMAALFQRVMNLCAWLSGVPTYFLEDPRQIAKALRTARPTVLIGVPRFYEKVAQTFAEKTRWIPRLPGMRRFKNRLFRRAFGGRVRVLISGSAACPAHVLAQFEQARMPILEAYGLSENLMPVAANSPAARKPGSVGKPLGNQDVRISAEGEVEVKGDCLFEGAKAMFPASWTDDGFFRTGDLGSMDEEGFLYLRGRIKEMIKTSRGRQVLPVPLESEFKAVTNVSEVVLLGNDRGGLFALVHAGNAKNLQAAVAAFNARRLPAERVQAVLELKEGLTIASGFLTTNFKYRRAQLEAAFAPALDRVEHGLETAADWTLNDAGNAMLAGWRKAP